MFTWLLESVICNQHYCIIYCNQTEPELIRRCFDLELVTFKSHKPVNFVTSVDQQLYILVGITPLPIYDTIIFMFITFRYDHT